MLEVQFACHSSQRNVRHDTPTKRTAPSHSGCAIARWKAIRVALEIDRISKDYSLSPHKKFQTGTIWVSDDDLRLPLRIEVKVFVGSVFAELVEMKAEG